MEITAEYFEQCTGHKPEIDDLERCNCKKAGKFLHMDCGWNHSKNMPVFMVGKEREQITLDVNGNTVYPGDITIKGNIVTPGFSRIDWSHNLDTLTKHDLAHIIDTLQSKIKRDADYIETLKYKMRSVRQ